MATKPMIIAHRGASGYRPEHTRAAYHLAIDLGAEAIEPDIVFTSDHVPIIRHDFYLGDSTDIADRPEFADRRREQSFAGHTINNWFVIDFSWEEIQSLKCRERIPDVRPLNDDFVGEPILRLSELVKLMVKENLNRRTPLALVLEIKQATMHEQFGVDVVGVVMQELEESGWFTGSGAPLLIESFELPILEQFKVAIAAKAYSQALDPSRVEYVFLVEKSGAPMDEMFRASQDHTYRSRSYKELTSPVGLKYLHGKVDGISFNKTLLLTFNDDEALISSGVVERTNAAGFKTYAWTLRAEAKFLERVKAGKTPTVVVDQDLEDPRLWQEEFVLLMETGLDGVFVDQPDLGLEIRAALKGPN